MLETSIVLTCFDPRNTYVLLKVQGSVKMILLKTVSEAQKMVRLLCRQID